MADRYAVIVKNDAGQEVISDIKQMEGVAPEVRDALHETTTVEKIADGPVIGMVRGGPIDSVGGFGFPDGSLIRLADRGQGITRIADANAAAEAEGKPVSNPDNKSRYASDGSAEVAEKPNNQVSQQSAASAKDEGTAERRTSSGRGKAAA